jgi:hypothetical protein
LTPAESPAAETYISSRGSIDRRFRFLFRPRADECFSMLWHNVGEGLVNNAESQVLKPRL